MVMIRFCKICNKSLVDTNTSGCAEHFLECKGTARPDGRINHELGYVPISKSENHIMNYTPDKVYA